MGDRTDAEREAARLERERRRAQREGRRPPAEPPPYEPPPYEPPPQQSQPPTPVPPPTFATARPPAGEPDPEPSFQEAVQQPPNLEAPTASYDDPAGPGTEPARFAFDSHADDDQPDEPSGTRRISALDRMSDRPRRRVRRSGPAKLPHGSGRRSVRKRVGAGIALVLAAAVIWFVIQLFQPFIGSPYGRSFNVTIPHGSSAGQIGDLLAQKGVIDSSFFFGLRATLDGDRGSMIAGNHRFRHGMSYGDVLSILTTPPKAAPTTELTLTPGKSRLQTQQLLNSERIKGSYVAATRHSPLLNPRVYLAPKSTPDLEGFLFPDTYQLRKPVSISALVADQLKEFKLQFQKISLHYAESKKLTPYDVLKIASIIEGETPLPQDRPYVAAVIYNRLRLGMTLGMDDTVQFASGNYTKPLTLAQRNSNSPFNTRTHTGLPPTPIDSPSLASIKAAAHPARSNALYFVAVPCGHGKSVFTNVYSQFLHDSALYQHSIAPGAHCK